METYIIKQKQTNSGSIHDIASKDYDREIRFPKGSVYAVVLAAYYGGKGYYTYRTETTAMAASVRKKDYSHQIIDVQGNNYESDGRQLVRMDK